VFTFCDDFLLKVVDLPWSRDEEWRSLLRPIYAALGVDESKVVRSLLARYGCTYLIGTQRPHMTIDLLTVACLPE
jgi:hypothetical protein